MTPTDPPPIDALYEWLLSDAPAAQRERARRRDDHRREAGERQAAVAAWCTRTLMNPTAPGRLRELAHATERVVERQRLRDAVEEADPEDLWLLRAREQMETSQRVVGDFDYRYPERYLGPGAGLEPIPDEPVTAGSLRPGDRVRLTSTASAVAVDGVHRDGDEATVVVSDGRHVGYLLTSRVLRVHDRRCEPDPRLRSTGTAPIDELGLDR